MMNANAGQPKGSTPSTFKFYNLEDQARVALHTLRILEKMFEARHDMDFEDEDFEATASLLSHVRSCLEPFDIRGVAGELDGKRFTLVPFSEGSERLTIVCVRCTTRQASEGGKRERAEGTEQNIPNSDRRS